MYSSVTSSVPSVKLLVCGGTSKGQNLVEILQIMKGWTSRDWRNTFPFLFLLLAMKILLSHDKLPRHRTKSKGGNITRGPEPAHCEPN